MFLVDTAMSYSLANCINLMSQLAIIASYSGDEFAATYRYFRSLAVETPFPTARDNLIVAFEKVN